MNRPWRSGILLAEATGTTTADELHVARSVTRSTAIIADQKNFFRFELGRIPRTSRYLATVLRAISMFCPFRSSTIF